MASNNFVGIFNQGSTCYLNSVIQALFHLPYFRHYVYHIKALQLHPLTKELRNIFALLEVRCSGITTLELTKAFGWDAYETSFQHDVHELVQQLFDCMETTLKGTAYANLINDLFGGLLAFRSRTVDGSKYVADRLQTFYDVELVVKDKHNITESLAELSTPEKIEGVSLELTPGAKPTVHAIERMQRFLRLPPILLIHPNRAAYDLETGEPITLDNRWEFDVDLDLAAYMINPGELHLDEESKEKMRQSAEPRGSATAAGSSDAAPELTLPQKLGTRYRLRAILTHAGNTNIGHYYTYIRFQDQWLRFNDEIVEPATVDEVRRSAFGERGATDAVHDFFRHERASLLVYINADCEAAVLSERPAPPELLVEARRQQEALAQQRQSSGESGLQGGTNERDDGTAGAAMEARYPVPYLLCEEAPLYLEDPYSPLMRDLRMATVAESPPRTVAEARLAIAAQLGVAPQQLRLLYAPRQTGDADKIWPASLSSAPLQGYPFIVQVYQTPMTDEEMETRGFFAFVRCVAPDGLLQSVTEVVNSRAHLSQALTNNARNHHLERSIVYQCKYRPLRVQPIASLTDIEDGTTLLLCPTDMSAGELADTIEGQCFAPTNVMLVDRVSTQVRGEYYTDAVANVLPYSRMQRRIFRWLRHHVPATCPPSPDYIALHYIRVVSSALYVIPGAPASLVSGDDEMGGSGAQERIVGRLSYRSSNSSTLFFSLLPQPVAEVNLKCSVRLNLGWNLMPYVYLPRAVQRLTLDALIELTLGQVGTHMSAELVSRCKACVRPHEMASAASSSLPQSTNAQEQRPLRLLKIYESRIIGEYIHGTDEIDFSDAQEYELDPLSPQPQGYKLVNVLFCRRRAGEEYFGLPTNVCVSVTQQETGRMLLTRIAKKLKVPDAETVVKKWIVSVRSITSPAVRTAGKSDVLDKLVTELKGEPYCLLVDRPEVVALDGFDGARRGQAIVIHSTSTTELNNL